MSRPMVTDLILVVSTTCAWILTESVVFGVLVGRRVPVIVGPVMGGTVTSTLTRLVAGVVPGSPRHVRV